MCLIDDDGVCTRKQLPETRFLEFHVCEQKMMVDDHDIRTQRAPPCGEYMAIIVLRAATTEAVVCGGGDPRPDGGVLRHTLDTCDVAIGRGIGPPNDGLQFRRTAAGIETPGQLGLFEALEAEIVGTTFEQRDLDGHIKRTSHRRKILGEQLVLQVFGAGGD